MQKFLPLLFYFTCLSCKNETVTTEKDNVIQSQEQKIKELEERLNKMEVSDKSGVRDSVDYTQQYDPSKPEGQQTNQLEVSGKRKVNSCVFFLCTVEKLDGMTTYYTQYYNLEKSGFVEMELSINRLTDCLSKEIKRTINSVQKVSVRVQKFPSQKDAEGYYYRYIRPMKAYPYVSVDCTNL